MMRFKVLVILTSIILCAGFKAPSTYNLTVVIKNIEKHEGNIRMGLYDHEDTYLKSGQEFRLAIVPVTGSIVKYVYKNIPQGVYAISLYHDENKDGKCNRTFIGFPTEGYGFSNDIRPKISAPQFEDAKFNLNKNMEISITMVN